jgi:rod shape-determining protein MreC
MYDRKTVRRRRAVLGLLVAASLILITASFGDGLRSIERGALEVFGPIGEGASTIFKPVRDAAGWVGDTLDAKGDLEKTRKERDELRRELVAQREAAQENDELRALLNMDKRLDLSEQGPVTARVYGRSPTVWYSTITVDKGTSDGVREGQPVINGEGLVGQVKTASANRAQILLITDGESGVYAKINGQPVSGVVQPAVGDPGDLRLEYLGRNDKARADQVIVTSGSTSAKLPSRFPRGIPIGRVRRVDQDEGSVHVRPFADLRKLEFVQILTKPAA